MRRWTFASAITAPIALIGGGEWAAAVQPDGYHRVRATISQLAAEASTDRWIMTTALAVVGVSYLLTALGLTDARRPGRSLLALSGVATVAVAAFPQPHPAHVPAAGIAFVALAFWPVASGLPSRRLAMAATLVTAVLLAWFGQQLAGPWLGATERLVAWWEACWPLVCLLALRSRTGPDRLTSTRD